MSAGNKFLWMDLFSRKSESEITVLSTLKANQLFSKLSNRELKYLAKAVHVRTYEPGEMVFRQHEKGLGMYMIARGSIDIRTRISDKDEEIHITTLQAGSFFGELALIDTDSKRTATAVANGSATLVGFFKPDLVDIMERQPATGVKILFQLSRVLGRRLNETTEVITGMKREADRLALKHELELAALRKGTAEAPPAAEAPGQKPEDGNGQPQKNVRKLA